MSDACDELTARETKVFFAIDHEFVDHEQDEVAQGVYDALGALDAACPEAIELFRLEDLRDVIDAAEQWARARGVSDAERGLIMGAVRRLRPLVSSD